MSKAKLEILVIEDELPYVEKIKEMLSEDRNQGFNVQHVQSLADAVGLLQRRDFDVILVDLGLPDSNGLETALAVRNQSQRSTIVVLTRLDDEDSATILLHMDIQDYLIKDEMSSSLLKRSIRYAIQRKNDSDALRAVNADVKRSNKDLEMFASVASHDLQEPLQTITSYTELLQHKYRGKLDQQGDTYVRYIVDGVAQMHMLINDLLAYSRVGTRAKPFVPVKLNAVLDQALDSLSKSIAESNATVDIGELPEVEADDVQLKQVFVNLIGNAIKFRKKGAPLHIRVFAARKGEEWIIGVHDNGIGIEARFFDRIFEIFRRLHSRVEYEGSGIGLAICRKIVEQHGGRIWVESTFGEGSLFNFTIPMRQPARGELRGRRDRFPL